MNNAYLKSEILNRKPKNFPKYFYYLKQTREKFTSLFIPFIPDTALQNFLKVS